MKNKILLFAALLALGVTSCGGKPSSKEEQSEQPVPSSEVAPASSEQGPAETSQTVEPSSTPVIPSSEAPKPSSEAPASSQPAESSLPPEEQPQDYQLCTLLGYEFGGEAIKGKLVYWYGEGGNIAISEGTGEDKQYLIMDYTAGGQWFSGQVFVATPYAAAGDDLRVEFDVIPSVAGTITVNGNLFTLVANQTNHIKYRVTVGDNLRAIDLQFGKYDGNVIYPSATFKFTEPTIKPFNGTYHKASFGMMMGATYSEALSYYVKHGQKLFYVMDTSAFASYLPEGMVVKGWKDTQGNYATTETVVNADVEYSLEIVNAASITKRTVTYKVGSQVIRTDEVNDGTPISAPTFAWNEIGFGYNAVGFYDNEGLTQDHDFTAAVSSDQVIYVKRVINPSLYVQWGWAPEATFEYTDSKFSASHLNCGTAPGNQGWNVQVNFPNVPAENGVNYKLSFKYKLTSPAAGAVQVYDAAAQIWLDNLNNDGAEHLIEKSYSGSDYSINSFEKLTFELGQCGDNTAIEIYDLSLVIVA